MSKLELRVIAPTSATDKSPYKYHNPEVDMVIMRCTTGDMGILPGRVPCSMVLDNGVLRVFSEETETHFAIFGGVATVSDNIVTILTETAEKPKDITVDSVKTMLAEYRKQHDEEPDLNKKTELKKDIKRCQILLDVAATYKK